MRGQGEGAADLGDGGGEAGRGLGEGGEPGQGLLRDPAAAAGAWSAAGRTATRAVVGRGEGLQHDGAAPRRGRGRRGRRGRSRRGGRFQELREPGRQGPPLFQAGDVAQPQVGREPRRQDELPQPRRVAGEAPGLGMQAVLQGLDAGQRALAGERPAAFGDDARGGQDEGRAFGEAAADGAEAGGEFQQAGVVAGADRLLADAGGEQRRAQVPQQGGFQGRPTRPARWSARARSAAWPACRKAGLCRRSHPRPPAPPGVSGRARRGSGRVGSYPAKDDLARSVHGTESREHRCVRIVNSIRSSRCGMTARVAGREDPPRAPLRPRPRPRCPCPSAGSAARRTGTSR